MAKRKSKFVIIDGNAVIHRAFHALPPLAKKDGTVVNAVYGFLNILFKVIKELKPDYVAVTFDVKGPTFRHKMYKEYKATRKKQPQELYDQIPMVRDAVKAFGFAQYELVGYEADDVIGTITAQVPKSVDSYIVTGDIDALQLVDDHTFVYTMRKGVSDTVTYNESAIKDKFSGLGADQIVDYKALRGDVSDNIPGVKGIGEKGAITLLNKYKTIDNVLKHVDDITGANQKKLQAGYDDALLSKELATIKRDVPIAFSLEDAAMPTFEQEPIIKLIQELEFKSLLRQVPEMIKATGGRPASFGGQVGLFDTPVQSAAIDHKQHQGDSEAAKFESAELEFTEPDWLANSTYTLVNSLADAKQLAAELNRQVEFAFDTETTDLDPLRCELVGFSVCYSAGAAYYIPAKFIGSFKSVFENPQVGKIGHNAKFDLKVLEVTQGIYVTPIVYDTLLASYILNPGTRGHSLDALSLTEFGHQMMPYEELVGKGKSAILITEVALDKLAYYAAEDADYTWRLYELLRPAVVKEKLDKILDMELHLIPILKDMEIAGVSLNTGYLKKLGTTVTSDIVALEKKIHKIAGGDFNISSPTQLKEVLFDRLKLDVSGIKRTKTGLSTAASELEKLRSQHPIIDMISEYRELTKLKSTYIDALPALVNPRTKRLHTTYSQTIAATGRLASSDPNLQNIPIRTELGRKIRKAFVAPAGKVLLSLDYSQVELRIIAHMVNDKSFIDGFKAGEDVHARTAAELNDIAVEEVTKDMRRSAKSVNFGILYGMGVYGLARDSGMSFDESREYLDKYFTQHPAIAKYIEDTKALVAQQGYVESLFGRRRNLPDIQSGMPAVRAAAERAAINMPVQGTASDIMKLAMIDVAAAITAGKIQATMLLQVHDELVFEVDEAKVKREAQKIKESMEHVYAMKVPLVVDVSAGQNWQDLSKDLESLDI